MHLTHDCAGRIIQKSMTALMVMKNEGRNVDPKARKEGNGKQCERGEEQHHVIACDWEVSMLVG